jgi:predicted permease
MWATWDQVGADYFRTLGIPVLRGREITAEDVARRLRVCVINETMARFFFPDRNPIGHHVTDEYPTTRETYEIVGVVADARTHWLRGEVPRRFYANLAVPIGDMSRLSILVRTSGETGSLMETVRRSVAEVDRALPVTIVPVTEQIDRRLVTERLIAYLAASFGGLALVLSAIGLYGVMSYAVSLRTNEIGLRMALGAERRGVVWMVLRETFTVAGIGAAVGVPAAMLAARLLASQLFGLTPTDPLSISATLAVITLAAALAGYLPARRASRVDPIVALRDE